MTCCNAAPLHRRRFLALSGGVALGAGLVRITPARAAGSTEALLLSCMDYRLTGAVTRYMADRGLAGKYDHVILAGAAAGVQMDAYPAWAQTFWDHLDLAIKLHNIHTVILLDHRDCGAYKLAHGAAHAESRATETALHGSMLHKLRDAIAARRPGLKVETLLMALDGSVETI